MRADGLSLELTGGLGSPSAHHVKYFSVSDDIVTQHPHELCLIQPSQNTILNSRSKIFLRRQESVSPINFLPRFDFRIYYCKLQSLLSIILNIWSGNVIGTCIISILMVEKLSRGNVTCSGWRYNTRAAIQELVRATHHSYRILCWNKHEKESY